MNSKKINTLVENIRIASQNRAKGKKAFSKKSLEYKIQDVKKYFGEYLESKLTTTYKNYFPFSKPDALENYLTKHGVPVENDEAGNPRLYVSIQSNPLRIVLRNPEQEYEKTSWLLNG